MAEFQGVVAAMLDDIAIRIINLKTREDRKTETVAEMARIGLPADRYAFFEAKAVAGQGAIGCALSHAMAIAQYLYDDEAPFLMMLEDDICFRDPAKLDDLIEKLKVAQDLWDVFLLSHNFAMPVRGTQLADVYRVVNAQTTSGYLVKRAYARKLIDRFFHSAEMLKSALALPPQLAASAKPMFSCDIMWKALQVDDRFWATFPSLSYQRESYSDIEQKDVAYRA